MSVLAKKYRPKTFASIIGQDSILTAIQYQVKKRQPQAWMFSAHTGGGKTTLARIMALSYQCTHKPFGYPCIDCRKMKNDFSIHETNASKINGVAEIGQLVEVADHDPFAPSRKRIFILDEAQRLTGPAQNLLLKPFEDPPRSTIWLICTTDPSKILPALRRRCVRYVLRPLSYGAIAELVNKIVAKERMDVDVDGFLEAVYEAQITSAGLVLMALDNLASGLPPKAAVIGQETNVDTLRICRSVLKGDVSALRKELKKSVAEDVRLIRAATIGYISAVMGNAAAKEALWCSSVIQSIAETSRYEEGIQMNCLTAVLTGVCISRQQR